MALSTLAVKLLFAPLFIILTYVIQKRYGARWGGVFMAVPFIVTPILIVIYLDHGRDFFHNAVIGTYAGQIGLLFFIFTYANLAKRKPWLICVVAATTIYLISVFILSPLISNIWVGIGLWLVIWSVLMKTFTNHDRKELLPPAPKWDLWVRIASALALVFAVTGFANQLGPRYSGALAMYPVMTSIMSTFNHYRFGPNASIAMMYGLAQYLIVTALLIFPPLALFV